MTLRLTKINRENSDIFRNLAQAYEAEFSNLTHKLPNSLGLFEIDVFPESSHVGYLLYYNDTPIGFCVANVKSEIKDIAEFYIAPVMRKKNLGYQLAVMIFEKYPGRWQVRQIEGAIDAIHFWRRVIEKYTKNNYEESVVKDSFYGWVTRQTFRTKQQS